LPVFGQAVQRHVLLLLIAVDRPQAVKAGAVAPPLRGFGLDSLMPPRFLALQAGKGGLGGHCGPLDYPSAGSESLAVRLPPITTNNLIFRRFGATALRRSFVTSLSLVGVR